MDRASNQNVRSGPATATAAATTSSAASAALANGGGLGSPPRIGHFAKYAKPKIGLAFQCAVPKFVPPGTKEGGGADNFGESGDSENASGAGSGSGYGTRSSSKGGRGGNRKGARGGRGGKGRGGRGKGGGRGRGGSEPMCKVEQSIASGETSAVDIANAAANDFRDQYDGSLKSIPRGGLCIHRPQWHQDEKQKKEDSNNLALTAGVLTEAATSFAPNLEVNDKIPQPERMTDDHEDYLTYTRNLYLQTPRPRSDLNIDEIWDTATAKKFKVETPAPTVKSGRGGRGKVRKRKAAAAALSMDMEDDGSAVGNTPSSSAKSFPEDGPAICDKSGTAMSVEQSLDSLAEAAKSAQDQELLPLCGLEADEQALSYLQANHHGDMEKAKLSIMIKSDRGYGKASFINMWSSIGIVFIDIFSSITDFLTYIIGKVSNDDGKSRKNVKRPMNLTPTPQPSRQNHGGGECTRHDQPCWVISDVVAIQLTITLTLRRSRRIIYWRVACHGSCCDGLAKIVARRTRNQQ